MKSNKEIKEVKYRILVVDNDIDSADSLSILLKSTSYSIVSVSNVDEAIEALKNERFNLLILGFSSTSNDLEETIEKIRKRNKKLYILLLAKREDIQLNISKLKKLDIQGYCEKNDKFDKFVELIDSIIKSNIQLNILKQANRKLQTSNRRLEKSYLETIEVLRYTVEAKDFYTRGHSDRVSEYSVLIGRKMGLSSDDISTLRIGGLFHDIGKIGIPDSIILKDDKLTDEEYAEIKNHPSIGAHILSNATVFKEIVPIVLYHHEWYDGNGYPKGLKGKEIPLLARIAAVADTFDAMTSKRSYRNEVPLEEVKEELIKYSGTQFDPEIVNIFINILENNYDKILKIQEKYSG